MLTIKSSRSIDSTGAEVIDFQIISAPTKGEKDEKEHKPDQGQAKTETP